ncbi:MAG: response regulator [Thiolinea sp.]
MNTQTFASAEDFLKHYNVYMIGCLVLDVRMPGISGLQLQQQLNTQPHALPIIFITGHGDVPLAVRAIKQGAVHFLEKPLDDQELLDTINNALQQDHANQQLRLNTMSLQARYANLTERETQVFNLVTRRYSNQSIAERLGIKIKTVEFHRAHMMEKMHADSLHDLLDMARIVQPELQQESLNE